jgi:hypothetical protein
MPWHGMAWHGMAWQGLTDMWLRGETTFTHKFIMRMYACIRPDTHLHKVCVWQRPCLVEVYAAECLGQLRVLEPPLMLYECV